MARSTPSQRVSFWFSLWLGKRWSNQEFTCPGPRSPTLPSAARAKLVYGTGKSRNGVPSTSLVALACHSPLAWPRLVT